MTNWNDNIIAEFHANDGRVGGPFAGAHLLLLTTTGAKSGLPRVAPMMYFTEGDSIYVIASKAGAPTSPDWYHNLVANPEVHVEQSTDAGIVTFDATAEVLERPERDRLFAIFSAANPGFADYQTKTTRIIPVVKLNRTN
ncbi:nitroreductase family deazaflavin-dependent oxidoreductase [Parafrigoribacterium humi]|jgi:deazaflavin-dependent oxidoreductase (nitroreductase family)|uniref:nitroreductase family deazaflavin-dependent oxidoreductase n=1 Tax=Parafrigoribacterium humi TaxID=3144664 RepID=UPI0032EF79E2